MTIDFSDPMTLALIVIAWSVGNIAGVASYSIARYLVRYFIKRMARK